MSNGINRHMANTMTAVLVLTLRFRGHFFDKFWEELEPKIGALAKVREHGWVTPEVRRKLRAETQKVLVGLLPQYFADRPSIFFGFDLVKADKVGSWSQKEFGEFITEEEIADLLLDHVMPQVLDNYNGACEFHKSEQGGEQQ